MFDFAWTEIALIGVVALVAIGPKDLPVAIKTVAGMIKKARRMAAEFQTHVDDLVREADLHEVRDQINQIRNFDIRGEIEKAVDSDGSIRSTLATNPLTPTTPVAELGVSEAGVSDAGAAITSEPIGLPTGLHDHVLAELGHTAPGEGATSGPADQSRNVLETRVIERPADTVQAPPAAAAEPPSEPPAFIPPGTHRV